MSRALQGVNRTPREIRSAREIQQAINTKPEAAGAADRQ
jgi:hypothetical protein